MEARPDLDVLPKITAASNNRLTNGTLDRIRRATNSTSIDTLAELAATFGLQAWHLLLEDLDPLALPTADDAAVMNRIKSLMASPVYGASTPAKLSGKGMSSDRKKDLPRTVKPKAPTNKRSPLEVGELKGDGVHNGSRPAGRVQKQGAHKRP
jgi:hypothetical protein